jgi:hypothetical protein
MASLTLRLVKGSELTHTEVDNNFSNLNAEVVPAQTIVSGTTQAAVKNNHYVLTNVAATTVTLPASPAAGDLVWVTVANGLNTNVVARNSQPIMSLAEDMTLDTHNTTVCLRYGNATIGWRVV